jgi:ABC-2 type transport system ATP-binding protein
LVSAAAIETHDLTKHYGAIRALERLSLRVEPGEIFGFLGPNGAGKTTTIRLLLGLIAPTAGRAQVLGCDTSTGSTWRQDVGYLPGTLALWPALSGARTLDMLADLTGRPPAWRAELVERLHLSDADLARRVGSYSDGMRQKIGIVQALQCAPRLVLLDEPSKGLDPLIQVAFYDLLFEVARRHTTVFFSSHVLPEVERVCHRVAMLRAGALVSLGDVDDLRRALPRKVTVVFRDDSPAVDVAEFGRVVERSGRRVVLLVAVDRVPALAARLASTPVADLLVEPQRLEDAFLEQYR